jgi:hypothetical protein
VRNIAVMISTEKGKVLGEKSAQRFFAHHISNMDSPGIAAGCLW